MDVKRFTNITTNITNTRLGYVAIFVAFILLYFSIGPSNGFLWRLPEIFLGGGFSFWQVPALINDSVDYLISEWLPIEVYQKEFDDYEESTVLTEITRAFSGAIEFLINLVRELILGGVKTIVAFTSWDFVSDHEWLVLPALPWTVVVSAVAILGYALKGWKLATFAGTAIAYTAIFGQWQPAMETLSFVLVSVPLSFLSGLFLGILAYKSKSFETFITPLLNVAQTMPHFSYLVPAVVLFGIGDQAGAIATVIFATPPMVRLTLLGLKRVSPEVVKAGMMSGCNQFQLLFQVLIPTARRDILLGVNQIIMQCLAMAVIASFIGTKGLGFNLLVALNQLRVGQALELGISIVLIAVVLDKLSLAWANKPVNYFADELTFRKRHKYLIAFLICLAIGILFAVLGRFIFVDINYFYLIPHTKGLTTQQFWQSGVDWMVENWYHSLQGFNVFLITEVLVPMKETYLASPFIAVFILVVGLGYMVGGIRSAFIVGGFITAIALTEWWDRALITTYMMTFAVTVSSIIGIILGTFCSRSELSSKVMLLICDTFQTFPSFIYLIPVIMLFGVTDTSVLIAVIFYATIPATRYTVEGIRSVPPDLLEAGLMSGTNSLQRLFFIEFPLAFPHIMLGINQTVMFSLFMIIIGAFIGTDDLGQLILKSLSDEKGIGNGLVLGLCVAFIGLTVDHIISTWSNTRKKQLGIS